MRTVFALAAVVAACGKTEAHHVVIDGIVGVRASLCTMDVPPSSCSCDAVLVDRSPAAGGSEIVLDGYRPAVQPCVTDGRAPIALGTYRVGGIVVPGVGLRVDRLERIDDR